MKLRSSLWLLPISFLVHDGEEILTMPAWFAHNQATLDRIASMAPFARRVVENLSTTTPQVAMAVVFELAFILAATVLVSRKPERGFGLYFYAAILGAYALHVLTHVGQAALFGGYTPGVVSVVAVTAPACVYLYRRLFEAGLLTWRSAATSAAVGILMLLPMVLLAHRVGRTLM